MFPFEPLTGRHYGLLYRLVSLEVFLLSFLVGMAMAVQPQTHSWESVPGGRKASLPMRPQHAPGFSRMELKGINFTNTPPPGRMLENQVRYNGCGVAAGDVDGDGLCDLFFCSLEGRSHLYKNLGHWNFVEITDEAGVGSPGLMTSGATFADIDGDGDLDLLVNTYGQGTRLFINDGKGHFTDQTDAGLFHKFAAMSLTLADIDGNGTLDLYVTDYSSFSLADRPDTKFSLHLENGKPVIDAINGRPIGNNPDLKGRFLVEQEKGKVKQMGEAHVLYLNQGNGKFVAQSWTEGRFLDESGRPLTEAPLDWGLSAMFRDLNGDGIPDLYVCNDLFSPDRIWINDGQGHFRAASSQAIRHTSRFSMGIDFADINRDGLDDFLVVDMLSRSHRERMLEVIGLDPDTAAGDVTARPQYNQNTLFLGRGDGTYAEISALAGLDASGWSWMPLFLDVDLDGYEDVLFTAGYFRDSLDADLTASLARETAQQHLTGRGIIELQSRLFPRHVQSKSAFRNRGDLTFEDSGARWGFNDQSVSQGMCLADLDNDGDLDVIVNQFDSPPALYRNEAAAPLVAVRLKGLSPNTRGIGSRIRFHGGPVEQSQEMICGGRYLSSDDTERVFATGQGAGPFSIEVNWRSGKHSLLTNVTPNCLYEVDEAQALTAVQKAKPILTPAFRDVSSLLNHRHQNSAFDDFSRQPLLPHKLSQAGPALAWTDVDGDGRPDLVVGAGRGGATAVFLNDGKGGFSASAAQKDPCSLTCEQGGIAGLPTPSGSSLLMALSNFETPTTLSVRHLEVGAQRANALPPTVSCPGPLALADVDGDGRLDLFVGGRLVPDKFPAPASSHLFRRTPDGRFANNSDAELVLKDVGLVNGAIFSDLDGDGLPELILACEWGPLKVFHNDHGHFREINGSLGLDKFTGWWNGVAVGDFDGDGRMDIVASNWGRNTRFERQRTKPLRLYYGNWNGTDSVDSLEAAWDEETAKYVPLRPFDSVKRALPWIQERFTTYRAYGSAGITEVLGDRAHATKMLEVNTLETMVFLNRGDHFETHPLPAEAQFAPAFGLAVGDFDGDGHEDIFLAQNFFAVNSDTPRYDAGRGLWLRGDGHGNFTAVPGQESGFAIYGEQRAAALCDYDADGRVDLVVSQHHGPTRLFHNESAKPGLRVILTGPEGNRGAFGAQIRLGYAQGFGPTREIHGGGGYWSQDDATQVLGMRETPKELQIRWPGGKTTTTPLSAGTRELTVDQSGKAVSK